MKKYSIVKFLSNEVKILIKIAKRLIIETKLLSTIVKVLCI